MKLILKHCENPDIGAGYWDEPEDSPAEKSVYVDSFKEASKVCREFIQRNFLGGGNWSGGQIYDDSGTQIAHVSYNGRVWEGETWGSDSKEIL